MPAPFWTLQDFAPGGSVIDNGTTNSLSAWQNAANSGERVFVPPTAYSYKLDGYVFIDGPTEFSGHRERSVITRHGNSSFVLRWDGILFDGFRIDDTNAVGEWFFIFGTSVRGMKNCRLRNFRSQNNKGGFARDENSHATAPNVRVLYDTTLEDIHLLHSTGPGLSIHDASAGFFIANDFHVGLLPGVNLGTEFYNFAGAFLTRFEVTGSAGLAGASTTEDLMIFENGAALHLTSGFADNAMGRGIRGRNLDYVKLINIDGSICNREAIDLENVKRLQGSAIRGQGRNHIGGTGAACAVRLVNCEGSIASLHAHNAGYHGVYTNGRTSIAAIQCENNTGYGYVADGAGPTSAAALTGWGNGSGLSWTSGSQHKVT